MSDENDDINEKFRAVVAEAAPQIEECLRMARLALKDAEAISRKYGVPYTDDIRWRGRLYTPESFIKKGWNLVTDEDLLESVGVYDDTDTVETGWASSYC